MPHSAAIGAGRNPPFGGGRYRLPEFFSIGILESECTGTNHRKTKEFKECGAATPPRFFMEHPPLCPCSKKHAVPRGMKNTPDLAPQTGSENRVARNVE